MENVIGCMPVKAGLKLHLPRGFVPIIHIGHVKQTERHDADCLRCFNVVPFLYRVGVGPSPSPRARGSPDTQTGTSRDDAFACVWTCQKSCPLSFFGGGVASNGSASRAPIGGRTCASGDRAPWWTCQKSCPLLDTVRRTTLGRIAVECDFAF